MSLDLDAVEDELMYFTDLIYKNTGYSLDSAKPLLSIALDLYSALREREAVSPLSGTAA